MHDCDSQGIYRHGGTDSEIDRVYVYGCGAGVRIWASDNTVRNSIIRNNGTGISLASNSQIIIGNHFWGNDTDINSYQVGWLKIIGNHFTPSTRAIQAISSDDYALPMSVVASNVIEVPSGECGILYRAWDKDTVYPADISHNVFKAGTGADAASAGIKVEYQGGQPKAVITGNSFYGDYDNGAIYYYDTFTGNTLPLNDGYVHVKDNYGFNIGGGNNSIKTVASDYTMSWLDSTILGDAGGGAITVTLPDPTIVKNEILTVKKIDSSTNVVTVAQNGSETIDGATSVDLTGQYDSIRVVSGGTNWWKV